MVVEKKINEVVNRLNRTKEERFPDLRLEREQRDQEERDDKRKELQATVSVVSFADIRELKIYDAARSTMRPSKC